MFHFRAPALPAQRLLAGPPRRASKPPSEELGALGRTLNVQRVRLACGPRAPPCIWTFLSSPRVFPHPARSLEEGSRDVVAVRAPALPAPRFLGGRRRKGAEAPLPSALAHGVVHPHPALDGDHIRRPVEGRGHRRAGLSGSPDGLEEMLQAGG